MLLPPASWPVVPSRGSTRVCESDSSRGLRCDCVAGAESVAAMMRGQSGLFV